MKQLSADETALLQEIRTTFNGNEMVAAEVECVLRGSLIRFHNMERKEEDIVRALAAAHNVELPC